MGEKSEKGPPPQARAVHRLVIIEDHAMVRQGLVKMVDEQLDLKVVGQAEDVPSGLAMIAKAKPSAVVVDVTLKRGNGLELVKTATSQDPNLAVLVLSMHEEGLHAQAALRAGAKGYVMKDENISQVLHAIRQVLAGKIYLSGEMVQKMIGTNIKGASSTTSPVEQLSDREKQVYQMISEWKRPAQIARELNLSVKTVEYYRDKIKEKLNLNTASEIMQFAIADKGGSVTTH
jgi:DNA-binding NarL/FixJ family response regulator